MAADRVASAEASATVFASFPVPRDRLPRVADAASAETPLSNLLLYRFAIFNALMIVFAVVLFASGIALPLFEADTSRISIAIVALFAAGLVWTAREVTTVSSALNVAKREGPRPGFEAERDKDLAKVEWINAVSGWLVALGLLGTVIGFWMALAGIDQGSVSQASGAQAAVTSLMAGMQVAINTTLVGAVLGLWNEVNFRILKTALAIYWSDRLLVSQRRAAPYGSARP